MITFPASVYKLATRGEGFVRRIEWLSDAVIEFKELEGML
jgi:hypothetical protein